MTLRSDGESLAAAGGRRAASSAPTSSTEAQPDQRAGRSSEEVKDRFFCSPNERLPIDSSQLVPYPNLLMRVLESTPGPRVLIYDM